MVRGDRAVVFGHFRSPGQPTELVKASDTEVGRSSVPECARLSRLAARDHMVIPLLSRVAPPAPRAVVSAGTCPPAGVGSAARLRSPRPPHVVIDLCRRSRRGPTVALVGPPIVGSPRRQKRPLDSTTGWGRL